MSQLEQFRKKLQEKFDDPDVREDISPLVRLLAMDDEELEKHLSYTKLYQLKDEEDDPLVATSESSEEEEPVSHRTTMDRQPLPPNVRPVKPESPEPSNRNKQDMRDALDEIDRKMRDNYQEYDRRRSRYESEGDFKRTIPYRNQPYRYDMQRLTNTRPGIPPEFIPTGKYPTSYLLIDCVKNKK